MGTSNTKKGRSTVIFLDIDGVLNKHTDISEQKYFINETLLENFKQLVDRTGSKIVLSSTWRLSKPAVEILNKTFDEYGIPRISSKTSNIQSSSSCNFSERPEEIYLWLKINTDYFDKKIKITNFVILDDMDLIKEKSFAEYRQGHFVKIDPVDGLTKEKVAEAIKILEYV